MSSIDLDDLARGYAFRPPTRATLERARDAVDGQSGPWLDVGGGTGAHAEVWAGGDGLPIVVDPSPEMCAVASMRQGVTVTSGRSRALPFVDACAGLVYFHLSIHYDSYHSAIDEACRVARAGARIEVWSFDPDAMESSALAAWFPSIGPIDAARFPPIDEIVGCLERHGAAVEVHAIPETIERTAASWSEAVRNRFVSTLQLVSPTELEDGLARFAESYPNPTDLYRYTIDFVRIRATR